MKINWRIIFSFFIPIVLAICCFAVVSFIMNGKRDCDYFFEFDCIDCQLNQLPCAGEKILLFRNIFEYCGIGLVILSVFLPAIIILRNRIVPQTKLFN